jgi:Bacterial Ig-like domain
MFRRVAAAVIAILVSVSVAGAGTSKPAPARSAAAANTQIMLFNQTPAAGYTVRKNNVASGTVVANPSGVLLYEGNATTGDQFTFLMTGVTPVSPAAPTGLVATGNQQSCVSLSWNPPAASDYVTGYSLLWKTGAGAYTDSVAISGADISKGAKWVAGHCGFASGTYTFALRAHNAFDRWSAPGAPSSTSITNPDTQGPVPPTNVKVTETSFGCASITWTKSSDPTVTGYRVFFGTHSRTQSAYTDSIDAGSAANAQRCGLAAGSYYFAVRAYTGAGAASPWSKEVTLTARGADTAAPTISQRAPASGATGVPLNAGIYFVATDDKTGVDAQSISVHVNGTTCPFSTSPATGGVAVQCDPASDFAPDSDVQVVISIADLASPHNVAQRTYSFHTGTSATTDNNPPATAAASPAADATGVDPAAAIDVRLDDPGMGVDFSSIVLTVNGTAVAFSVSGDPAHAHIRYQPAHAFAVQSTVRVHVDACDRAQPPHCTALDYGFTVGSANAALTGRGAIVPDGFWAGDPTRQLEVRDIPHDWAVRIFDTAGTLVRRHLNENDGATWWWDFRNENGQRVAPALYLVRVTDSSGTVQRSGRFVVQSQR